MLTRSLVDPSFVREKFGLPTDKPLLRPITTRASLRGGGASSRSEDYRSVIDDLTAEIRKLKDELRIYKQHGPERLRGDEVFRVRPYGLSGRGRQVLEVTLREFIARLKIWPQASSSRRKEPLGATHTYKHASASSGSCTPPVDSAYASISTTTSLHKPSSDSKPTQVAARIAKEKVENYLYGVTEGLYREEHAVTADLGRESTVVKRAGQLSNSEVAGQSRSSHSVPARNGNNVTKASPWAARRVGTRRTKCANKGQRKLQEPDHSPGDFDMSSSAPLKDTVQASTPSESFHYQPLFARSTASNGRKPVEFTSASVRAPEKGKQIELRTGLCQLGSLTRGKHRQRGAIVYYSGASFFADLSGDCRDGGHSASPESPVLGGHGSVNDDVPFVELVRPCSESDPSESCEPLGSDTGLTSEVLQLGNANDSGPLDIDTASESGHELSRSKYIQGPKAIILAPSGLGGVLPADHFVTVVTTKRYSRNIKRLRRAIGGVKWARMADKSVARLATSSTSPEHIWSQASSWNLSPVVQIAYTSVHTKRLAPVPLPPPIFVPLFSSEESYETDSPDTDHASTATFSERLMGLSVPDLSEGLPTV